MEKISDMFHDTTDICYQFVAGIGHKLWYKCGSAISIFWLQFAFSGIEYVVIAGIFGMIIIDLITRIIAEFKKVNLENDTVLEAFQKGKFNHIESKKMSRTIVKIVVYSLMIASGSFAEIVIGSTINLPITELVAITIGFQEFYSILENLRDAGYVVSGILFKKTKDYVQQNIESVKESSGEVHKK